MTAQIGTTLDRWDHTGGAMLWLAALVLVAAPALGAQAGAAWCGFAGVVLGVATWSARAELKAAVRAFALLDAVLIAGAGAVALVLWPWPETSGQGMEQGLALAANAAIVSALLIRTYARMRERTRAGVPIKQGAMIALSVIVLAVLVLLVRDLIALAR